MTKCAVMYLGNPALAQKVAKLARNHDGITCPVLDLSIPATDKVSFGHDIMEWNGLDLRTLEHVFVTGFCYQEPALPPPQPTSDLSMWQFTHVTEQQKQSFRYGLLCRMAAAGVRLYNAPDVHVNAFAKTDMLDQLAQHGLDTPDRCLTNHAKSANSFMEQHSPVVWRTVTGQCAWQLFTHRQKDDLVKPAKPPVLLANIIKGPLLRAYVLDQQVVAVLEYAHPHMGERETLETFRHYPHVTEAMTQAVQKAADALGLAWGCFTLVHTGSGKTVFYDVETDPQLLSLPGFYADKLATQLANVLATGHKPQKIADDGQSHERKALMLRRMLQIGFAIEDTKYQPQEQPADN